ncbi:hypothetical protein L195_g062248, partial [Trifolium pratense]
MQAYTVLGPHWFEIQTKILPPHLSNYTNLGSQISTQISMENNFPSNVLISRHNPK